MIKLNINLRKMSVLLLVILPLIHISNLYAQGYPDENETSSIFDESETTVESNIHSQNIGDNEPNFNIGILRPVASPSKKSDPVRETNGIPTLPGPPDAPVNGPVLFLFVAGLLLAVKKCYRSFSFK